MAANFPTNPSLNDTVIISDIKYRWNGSKWGADPQAIVNPIVQSNDGLFDLSKGNYHKIDINENNKILNVDFTNISNSSSRWYSEINISVPSPTELFNLSSQSVTNLSGIEDIAFNPDGTKMYALISSTTIRQYTLSIPWDVRSATYDNIQKLLSPYVADYIQFSTDGLKLFTGNYSSFGILQYTMAVPWDITTAIYDVVQFQLVNYPLSYYPGAGFYISNDGYYLYYADRVTGDSVYQYLLDEPWNIGDNPTLIGEFSIAAQDTSPYGLSFTGNGKTMYVASDDGDDINIYNLSIPWDVSTATYSNQFYFSPTAPRSIRFGNNAEFMYIIKSSIIYQYVTAGTQYDISITWPENVIWEGGTPPYLTEDQKLIFEFYSPDGGSTVYGIEYINIDNT